MTDTARTALAEKIARALAKRQGEIHDGTWRFYLPDAQDALAIALEEAAKVAEDMGRVIREDPPQRFIINGEEVLTAGTKIVDMSGIPEIAAAIRALIPPSFPPPQNKGD